MYQVGARSTAKLLGSSQQFTRRTGVCDVLYPECGCRLEDYRGLCACDVILKISSPAQLARTCQAVLVLLLDTPFSPPPPDDQPGVCTRSDLGSGSSTKPASVSSVLVVAGEPVAAVIDSLMT